MARRRVTGIPDLTCQPGCREGDTPARDNLVDLVDADAVLDEAAAGVLLALERLELLQSRLAVRDAVVAEVGRRRAASSAEVRVSADAQVVGALGDLGFGLERLDALAQGLDLVAAGLAGVEARDQRLELVVEGAQLCLGDFGARLGRGVLGLAERLELDLDLDLAALKAVDGLGLRVTGDRDGRRGLCTTSAEPGGASTHRRRGRSRRPATCGR